MFRDVPWLARQGVKVAILNRTEKRCKVAAEIDRQGGKATALAVHVFRKYSFLLEKGRWGNYSANGDGSIFIDGAGGNDPAAQTEMKHMEKKGQDEFFDLETEGFGRVFDNFKGAFLASPGVPLWPVSVEKKAPVIINISSMSAYSPMTRVPAYSAAKAAINNFTMWMAVHFAQTGLRVMPLLLVSF